MSETFEDGSVDIILWIEFDFVLIQISLKFLGVQLAKNIIGLGNGSIPNR